MKKLGNIGWDPHNYILMHLRILVFIKRLPDHLSFDLQSTFSRRHKMFRSQVYYTSQVFHILWKLSEKNVKTPFVLAVESDAPSPQRVCSRCWEWDRQVSLRPQRQLYSCVGWAWKPRGAAGALQWYKRRVHQGRCHHLPHWPTQPDDWSQGVQLQANTQIRLQVAGQ